MYILEALEKIGLNLNEAKIYLALLELKEAQAGEISKKTQINRTTVYDSLERLIERGLVSYIIEANRKVFRPINPDRLLDNIKEKENTLIEILPDLKSIFEQVKEEEESDLFRGKKGIKSILNDMLNYKEYLAFGSSGNFLKIMKHDFHLFQKNKKKLRIKARVILSHSSRNTEQVKVSYSQFKFIPDEFTAPTTTFVYDKKVAVIVWSEVPIATVIISKEVSQSYGRYFELLWKIAKK
jgi:sugar-specific transcriptional regulator TrmB